MHRLLRRIPGKVNTREGFHACVAYSTVKRGPAGQALPHLEHNPLSLLRACKRQTTCLAMVTTCPRHRRFVMGVAPWSVWNRVRYVLEKRGNADGRRCGMHRAAVEAEVLASVSRNTVVDC
jgi:hypothetical protein